MKPARYMAIGAAIAALSAFSGCGSSGNGTPAPSASPLPQTVKHGVSATCVVKPPYAVLTFKDTAKRPYVVTHVNITATAPGHTTQKDDNFFGVGVNGHGGTAVINWALDRFKGQVSGCTVVSWSGHHVK